MSDKEKVIELLTPIREFLISKKDDLLKADELLAKNQNRKPLGDADDSFTDREWVGGRDAFHAVHTFLHSYNRLTNAE